MASHINWKMLFADCISDRLLLKVYKEFENSVASMPDWDWAESKSSHFSRPDIERDQWSDPWVSGMLSYLIIKKMQIKAGMSFRKKSWQRWREEGLESSLLHCGRQYKVDPELWKSTEVPKGKINSNRATLWPVDPTSGIESNEWAQHFVKTAILLHSMQ